MNPKKIVDLSIVLYNSMPAWPTQPNFLYEQTSNVARDGSTNHIIHQMTTHTGTHIDTPLHAVPEGKSVDQLPVEAFMGEGVVVDLSHKKPKEEITVEDLKEYDEDIRTGDVLMLHTGWDKRLGFNKEYLFEWPFLVEETGRYLVDKGVKALGVDTLSVGGWGGVVAGHGPTTREDSCAETHRILLGAGIILVEVLRNLDMILDGERA
ncbi:cyclase family protein, partial [Candidatus Bathyarchaeota archaeon]|nr:cyclase family protein [Candidatus Bathyarchaeota archaeon]